MGKKGSNPPPPTSGRPPAPPPPPPPGSGTAYPEDDNGWLKALLANAADAAHHEDRTMLKWVAEWVIRRAEAREERSDGVV